MTAYSPGLVGVCEALLKRVYDWKDIELCRVSYQVKMFWPGVALLSLMLLVACSKTTFVYNRLPTFIPWIVDDYVELDKQQDEMLETLLSDYLLQHRREDLPRYVDLIDEALVMLEGQVTKEEMIELYNDTQLEFSRLQSESMGWVLKVAGSLSNDQVNDFVQNLKVKQTDYEEEYLGRDEKEFRRETYKNLKKGLANYLGRLDKVQSASLREASTQLFRWDYLWLEERKNWIDSLEPLLDRRNGWQDQIRSMVENRYELASERYKTAYNHNLNVTLNVVAAVIDSRTDKQDQRLRRKLNSLRDDLCQLIQQGADDQYEKLSIPARC